MNHSSVDQAAQLTKRSKELDAREAYLTTREELATETEKQLADLKRKLAVFETTYKEREQLIAQQQERSALLDTEYIRKQKSLEQAIEREQERYTKWQNKVTEAKANLQPVLDTITERLSYQKQQETLIAEQSEHGNLELRGLEYEIIEAKQVIKDLKVERVNIYQEKEMVEADLETARLSFSPELAQHELHLQQISIMIEKAEAELTELQQQHHEWTKKLALAKIHHEQVNTETDKKLRILDEREREIMAKREALRAESEEIVRTRRYYSVPESLYGGTMTP